MDSERLPILPNDKNMIVLVEPEIPYNTGNVARTCVVSGCLLGLVRPFGFQLTSKLVKRAGMDYWDRLNPTIWDDIEEFKDFLDSPDIKESHNIYYIETYGEKNIGQTDFSKPSIMIFGSESKGLPKDFLAANPERQIRIPMKENERSLNLSNSAAIALYEALRQQGYPGLK